jgi:hypothetical protein
MIYNPSYLARSTSLSSGKRASLHCPASLQRTQRLVWPNRVANQHLQKTIPVLCLARPPMLPEPNWGISLTISLHMHINASLTVEWNCMLNRRSFRACDNVKTSKHEAPPTPPRQSRQVGSNCQTFSRRSPGQSTRLQAAQPQEISADVPVARVIILLA